MISQRLRTVGMFLLDTLVAIFGTAVLESPIYKIIPTHSILGVVCKVWILSILIAAFTGFFMFRTWRSGTAKLAWILPTLCFCFAAISSLETGSPLRSLWFNFSGVGCEGGRHEIACLDFLMFTTTFLRGLSYSVAAALTARVYDAQLSPGNQHIA
jgi:hypothetical protein